MKLLVPTTARKGERGYVLIVMLLFVALMAIALAGYIDNFAAQVKHEREDEMIHRGVQYERAVRKFYKKFGRYPTTIQQLEETNKYRSLRKQYSDPLSATGKWRLLHQQDVNLAGMAGGTTGLGSSGVLPNIPGISGSGGSSLFGSGSGSNSSSGGFNLFGGSSSSNQSGSTSGSTFGSGTGNAESGGTTASKDSEDSNGMGGKYETVGGTESSKSAFGLDLKLGTTIGGGPILGVSSLARGNGFHEFARKDKYRDWQFVYVVAQDRGRLPVGPYDPNANNTTGTQLPGGGLPASTFGSGSTGSSGSTGPGGSSGKD